MIPESYVELRKLQTRAVVELRALDMASAQLERAKKTTGLHLQACTALDYLFNARQLARKLHVPETKILDTTSSAWEACDALRKAAFAELECEWAKEAS